MDYLALGENQEGWLKLKQMAFVWGAKVDALHLKEIYK